MCPKAGIGFLIVNLIFRDRERGQKFSALDMLNKGIV
jgi:hypothetical protein